MKKYHLPDFLESIVAQDTYDRWLHRKAVAHVWRDRRRGNDTATNSEYKMAIQKAVKNSKGKDAYTNEKLDWSLLSQYDNAASRKYGRAYKKKFALLPLLIMWEMEKAQQISKYVLGVLMILRMIFHTKNF